MRRVVSNVTLGIMIAMGAPAPAHSLQNLTIPDLAGSAIATGVPPANFIWSDDGTHYAYSVPGANDNAPPVLFVHDLRTGSDRKLFAAQSSARGSRSREIAQVVWSPDASHIALVSDGQLVVTASDGSHESKLVKDADDPQWSPDGRSIAYVHERDLYAIALATKHITRLTHVDGPNRTNGDPDWLYSEELDVAHAYRWSPDGSAIAYLSFDESHVTDFPIQTFLTAPVNAVEHQRYPLAGEANPRVALHVVGANGAGDRLLYDGAPHDEYLVSFTWTPNGARVVDEILDRAQQHLRLVAFERTGRSARTLLSESDSRFVNVSAPPRFLRDGRSFLWISEHAGIASLYRVATATGAEQRLSGTTPIGAIDQVDEVRGRAYVSALYPTRREHALLAFPIAGGAHVPENLTPGGGTHSISMPERGAHFIDSFSSTTSPVTIVRGTTGSHARAVVFRSKSLARYALGATSAISIDSPYGKLDATLVLPVDFDATKPYPVVVNVYGGPLPVIDGGEADDKWPGLFPHVLAERGFVSLYVDGPASRNDRADDVRMFSGKMGEAAILGPIAAADWLAKQPYVDAKRIGLFGWSYGGYLTAFTLTHAPQLFASGIAGAPPVDWRFYDTAYTERYMGKPQQHRADYDRTAVLPAARALRAHLLVLQGSSDDNVHLMNSMTLLSAFVRAGKQVDYFVFPGARHGPRGAANTRYLYTKMLDWWQRTLQPARAISQ
jgi:dipeptidyl-peptidase-4